jgi:hypothetical protein
MIYFMLHRHTSRYSALVGGITLKVGKITLICIVIANKLLVELLLEIAKL